MGFPAGFSFIQRNPLLSPPAWVAWIETPLASPIASVLDVAARVGGVD